MRSLNSYITEKFQVSKDNIRKYAYTPKDKDELIECIREKIDKEGLGTKYKPLDLNDIDTSNIIDMSYLFDPKYGHLKELSDIGYFDISYWDVSNVRDMHAMFRNSKFNGDISSWDVSKVKNMQMMFKQSTFNNNISDWDVSNVKNMDLMFAVSDFDGDIHNWDVRNVKTMQGMFTSSKFNNDITSWKVNVDTKMLWMFDGCHLEKNPPKWYHV